MSNRKFGLPIVMEFPGMTEPTNPDPTEIGNGSNTGGLPGNGGNKIAPMPCSFDTWLENYAKDYYKDGIIDFNDYGQWWADSGLGANEWAGINSGIPFKWESKK